MKLNEEIADLRRRKGITQEELARALGVSNQSVSKWESAQCCPDIALLPRIAEYFDVSIDSLLGYHASGTPDGLVMRLRSVIESTPRGDDFALTLRLAYTLHAAILSKFMTVYEPGNTGWRTDDAIEHAGLGEWGYSCENAPEITTLQRGGTVLFSNNRSLDFRYGNIREIANILKIISDIANLRILIAIYKLTVASEDIYATISEISDESGLSREKFEEVVGGSLGELLTETSKDGEVCYRIRDMHMHLVPLVWMLSPIE